MIREVAKITCWLLALTRLVYCLTPGDARESIQTTSSRKVLATDSLVGLEPQVSNEQHTIEPTWEYEPRVWVPDDEPAEDLVELDEILLENSNRTDDETVDSLEISSTGDTSKNQSESRYSPRDKSYFWDARRRHYGKIDVSPRQSEGQKCSQFRVDIRETVICDKRRCDKLDFEWPKHNNQIVVMETTKYGMRFHRSEYAFGQTAAKSKETATKSLAHSDSGRIKFDLLEQLFKPKPTNSPAPIISSPVYIYSSTSTTAPTTATTAPTTEEEAATETTTASNAETPSTETSDGSSTEPTSDTTTAASADEGGSTASIRDQAIRVQDNNQTRFVTTFRLNTKRRMQKIIGFGGALSDSTCRNIKSLSPAMSRSLMEDYFGPRGLRYNIARMTMGSSDFSTSPYTNNDRPNATAEDPTEDDWRRLRQANGGFDEGDDVEMKNFRLTEEDYEFKLPVARQAMATSQQAIKFYSSLWSPPVWMKNNSNIVHGWLKGDVYGPYYKGLAELIIKWLEAYRRQGIEFWATTGLNEPVTGIKPFIFHNSLGITRDDYITFIKLYLGPMLRQRGFKDTKIIAMDDNKGYAPNWARRVLDDKDAAKYVAGIGVHWYMNDDYENLNFLAKEHPDKFILSTEACNGYLPFQVHTLPGDWDRGVAYMFDILKLMHKNVAGWVDWNMALNLGGGPSWIKNLLDAPVIVNSERDEYYKSPMFYAIGHFSRFVEPESFRLDHRMANAKYDYPLEAAAFITPKDQIVIVVLNANHHRVPFRVIVDRQVIKVINLKADSFNTIMFNWKGKNTK